MIKSSIFSLFLSCLYLTFFILRLNIWLLMVWSNFLLCESLIYIRISNLYNLYLILRYLRGKVLTVFSLSSNPVMPAIRITSNHIYCFCAKFVCIPGIWGKGLFMLVHCYINSYVTHYCFIVSYYLELSTRVIIPWFYYPLF